MNFIQALTYQFRESDLINRQVLLDWLKRKDGLFLEVGPGSKPLIEHLTSVDNQSKISLDLPSINEYCKSIGFKCLDQNCSDEVWLIDNETIDVVVSNQCLEHIPNTDHFISECNRVLKTGGILILSVPNQGALAFLVLMLMTINPPMNFVSDKFYGLGNPWSNIHKLKRDVPGHNHLRLFQTRAMNELLEVYGFKIIENHGATWGLPFVGKFLAKIFPWYGLYTSILAEKVIHQPE